MVIRHTGLSWLLPGLLGLVVQWHSAIAQVSGQPELSYTLTQASAGKTAYDDYCASCHGANLEGLALAPSLTGERFAVQWTGKSVDVLFSHMRRMPLQPVADPGSLTDENYLDILAYVLQRNDVDSGAERLSR